MIVKNRITGKTWDENANESPVFSFLYRSLFGRFLLSTIVARPWFSRSIGRLYDTHFSTRFIDSFVDNNNIDMRLYEGREFSSFNDFFARQRDNSTTCSPDELVAVADSRLSAYPISDDLEVVIKGSPYTLEELTANCPFLDNVRGGTCLVFRLAVDDYHRYVYADDGKLQAHARIPGQLRTVRPIAGNEGVYRKNYREVSVLNTRHFGTILHIDVGATLVAKIVDEHKNTFSRLEEKGHFEYGGSTVILLVGSNICIDEDLLENTQENIETKVIIGERIGILNR
ncbi:MAG: phosphatidylserine decarboxylase [Actinomycetaceae bacterium]|nr:phosphatidylserine decarboxylase [Actinomycetaceae bacterium]